VRVLILVAVAIAGCYDPAIEDCQFACPTNQCPGDLTCSAGVCRLRGASGSCPCPDPPAGCSLTSNSANLCLAACASARTWPVAQMTCAGSPPWHLAVLDTSTTLTAGENALRSSPTTWIGLKRGAVFEPWAWITGGGTVAPVNPEWSSDPGHGGAANTCAALGGGKLYSDDCTVPHSFACTPN
jgi:hypothetical protein